MSMKLVQGLKQTQNLVMTPQLKQAIEMLTIAHQDMLQMITKEMVENPLLEEINEDSKSAVTKESDRLLEKLEAETKEAFSENFQTDSIVQNGAQEFDWFNYYENSNPHSSSAAQSTVTYDPDDVINYENMVSKGVDLSEHLLKQLASTQWSDQEITFIQRVIFNLNENGFIDSNVSYEDLLEGIDDFTKDDADEVLKILRDLDPLGCCCFDLRESLLHQIPLRFPSEKLAQQILLDQFNLLAQKNYDQIALLQKVARDDVDHAVTIIRMLDPRPGKKVSQDEAEYVAPDVYVHIVNNQLVVATNDEGLPKLTISPVYQTILKQINGSGLSKASNKKETEAQSYIHEKLRSAVWLIKSIQNRQRTILKVAQSIVRRQPEFFSKGAEFLKPMILKDVADEIGVHESTVSRVTVNKYMHTPRGMFELKYFFNTGIGKNSGGVELSSEGLKVKIKNIIDQEDPRHPLSDQDLVEILEKSDINVARRTVAKYREMLTIPSSSLRRKK